MAVWYLLLGLMRLYAVRGTNAGNTEHFSAVTARCGACMLLLAVALSGIVCMGIADQRNPIYPLVVMIALAAFTFCMVGTAIANSIRARKQDDGASVLLRDISLASAIGSVLSLERSMLGSFGDAADSFSFTMEAASGAVAFALVLIIGIAMVRRARKMA